MVGGPVLAVADGTGRGPGTGCYTMAAPAIKSFVDDVIHKLGPLQKVEVVV